MNGRAATASDPRRGVVLVTVLWSIALLSALAMAAAVSFRGFAGIAAVDRNRIQGEALLTAGLEAAAALANTPGAMSRPELETVVTLATGSVQARISDEGGRIDIGRAPAPVLSSLLRAVGVPTAAAEDIARRIAERRDPNGARTPDNNRRGAVAPPPKPPTEQIFIDIRELARIPGMTPQWAAASAPLATVFGNETVNPLTAPPAVLAALPGVDKPSLAAFLEMRRGQAVDAERLAQVLGPAQRFLANKPPRVLSIALTVRLMSGYATAAQAVIVLLPQDREPYRVLVWDPLPPGGL